MKGNIQRNFGATFKLIEAIINNFCVEGVFSESISYGSGHINETYLITINREEQVDKYILRKINQNVFKNPQTLVNNTTRITDHLRKKSSSPQTNREVLRLIRTNNNRFFHVDKTGEYWCLLIFICEAYTLDSVETTQQAYNAAKAFGNFTFQISDLDISTIYDTIPDFHNLENRLVQFDLAKEKDEFNRLQYLKHEITSIDKNRHLSIKLANLFDEQQLPIRIIHNDTKISNVMFDRETEESLAVIDLDTVMRGSILYDFGDMVRSYTNSSSEDSSDITSVKMRIDIFEAIVKGYLSVTKNMLSTLEIDNLVLGAEAIVFEQAVRFLSDYLVNDLYYPIKYADHNLIRAKNQFALLNSIQNQKSEMLKIINSYFMQG